MRWSSNKVLRDIGFHGGLNFGMPAAPSEGGGDHDEFVNVCWMANGGLQSHTATKRVTEQVGVFEFKITDKASDIVCQLLIPDRALREGRVAVSIEIDPNDLMVESECGSNCGE